MNTINVKRSAASNVFESLWEVPQQLMDAIMASIQTEASAALAAGVIDQPRMERGMAEARIRLTRSLVAARHYITARRTQLMAVAINAEGAKVATLAVTAAFLADSFGEDRADQAHGVVVMGGACASVGATQPKSWGEVLAWMI